MFRKISDMRVEYLFGLEIDMNSSDLELKERIIEIFKLLKKDIVKFYNEISKTNSYINENFKGSIYKKQIDRLERLIKEIATEKKKFASSENIEFKIDVIIDESFMEKLKEEKEEIKVIRKLEDFDEFPNGMGLKLRVDRQNEEIDIMYGVSVASSVLFKESCFKVLKAMGFKFEYKPIRTKEEVLADIKRLACERSQYCRTMILQDVNTNKYFATDDYRTLENDKKYFNENIAHDLVNEINEILESEQ